MITFRSTSFKEKNGKSQKKIQKLIDASTNVKENIKSQQPKTSATEEKSSAESCKKKTTFMKNIDIIEYSCEHCNFRCPDSASLDVHVYKKHSSTV